MVKCIDKDGEIARKLFRPFIHADFHPDKSLPARIGIDEHKWLRKHALMFGLDPERDLNIPPLPVSEQYVQTPIDERLTAELARFEMKRKEKHERNLKRQEKQQMRLVADGKLTQEELEEQRQQQDSIEYEQPYLPLRLRSRIERQQYTDNKLKSIEKRMDGMPALIQDWKKRRHEFRQTVKSQNKNI